MSTNDLSRRDFLLRLSAFGAVGTLLSACGGDGDGHEAGDMNHEAGEMAEEGGAMADEMAGCGDLSGLSEADRMASQNLRQSLQYVDQSPVEGKTCSNCALYVEAAAGAACGGCTLIKGPIAAAGYCTSWAPKPA